MQAQCCYQLVVDSEIKFLEGYLECIFLFRVDHAKLKVWIDSFLLCPLNGRIILNGLDISQVRFSVSMSRRLMPHDLNRYIIYFTKNHTPQEEIF